MSASEEGRAPVTRSARVAVFFLPAFLILGAVSLRDAATGAADSSLAVQILAGAGVLVAFAGVIWARRGERKDEREELIQLKAMRNAFGFLLIGCAIGLRFVENIPYWDVTDATRALVFWSMAVAAASVLIYARRGA